MSEELAGIEERSQRPFETHRKRLYTSPELLKGFDPNASPTLARSLDYRIYCYWVVQGRFKPNRLESTLQCLHDNAITYALARFIEGRRVVGIMGGHDLSRASAPFFQVGALARALAQNDYLVASGGGPGLMEAAHFGSLFAGETDTIFSRAGSMLASAPSFPVGAGNVVNKLGQVDAETLSQIADWFAVAIQVRQLVTNPCESLGIPTWRYGHEPTAVFATHIAKYFENSVREDGLLSIADCGIIYAQGGAGTLQEVFQSAVFNAYTDVDRGASPMIFLGTAFWTQSGVLDVLRNAFGQQAFENYVTCTDEITEVLSTLTKFACNRRELPRRAIKISSPSLPHLSADAQRDSEENGDRSID